MSSPQGITDEQLNVLRYLPSKMRGEYLTHVIDVITSNWSPLSNCNLDKLSEMGAHIYPFYYWPQLFYYRWIGPPYRDTEIIQVTNFNFSCSSYDVTGTGDSFELALVDALNQIYELHEKRMQHG